MIEQTLVLIKPDGVKRGLIGEIIKRFEQRGLKIVAMKMIHPAKELAEKHYTEDIEKRRGKIVRENLLEFITSNPVIAIVIQGSESVEVTRKIVGETEPKSATPGTIRGDYAHISFKLADKNKKVVQNLIHASSNKKEAQQEISIWFKKQDIYNYQTSQEEHIF